MHCWSIRRLPLAAEERQLENLLDLAGVFACVGDVWINHLHDSVVSRFAEDLEVSRPTSEDNSFGENQ